MDMDLLFTAEGEAGLISSQNMVKKAAGILVDAQSGLLTIEYVDMDSAEMNIGLDSEFVETLDQRSQIHFGAVVDGHIAQAYQVPVMFVDDPYRGELLGRAQQPANPLQAFEHFIKRCVRGQPVHREDLSNDENMGCVLGDASPSSLQFAPHLARRHAMESKPSAQPSAPGMNVPGLGGSSKSGGGGSQTPPPTDEDS